MSSFSSGIDLSLNIWHFNAFWRHWQPDVGITVINRDIHFDHKPKALSDVPGAYFFGSSVRLAKLFEKFLYECNFDTHFNGSARSEEAALFASSASSNLISASIRRISLLFFEIWSVALITLKRVFTRQKQSVSNAQHNAMIAPIIRKNALNMAHCPNEVNQQGRSPSLVLAKNKYFA
ncbi:TPA: hypothetical protein I6202_002927 [Vibrio cholerae]|nr:hypothetical protein [Vibrio cholerae]